MGVVCRGNERVCDDVNRCIISPAQVLFSLLLTLSLVFIWQPTIQLFTRHCIRYMSQPNWANHNCPMGQTTQLPPPTERGVCQRVCDGEEDGRRRGGEGMWGWSMEGCYVNIRGILKRCCTHLLLHLGEQQWERFSHIFPRLSKVNEWRQRGGVNGRRGDIPWRAD